jgi:hypothetical protein
MEPGAAEAQNIYGGTMKRFFVLVALVASVGFASAQQRQGSILFQAGLGLGFPKYTPELDAVLAVAEAQPGISRIKVGLDLGIGFAATEQLYVLVGIDGIGDRLTEGASYLQINSYLFSGGIRYYPSITGFYFGLGAGSAKMVLDADGSTATSPSGFGGYGCIGYDLNKNPRGFGAALEAKYDYVTISGDSAGLFMITANLCWK